MRSLPLDLLPDTEPQAPATLRSVTPDDAARAWLSRALADLERDEAHALTRIAERLKTTPRAGRTLGAIAHARALLSARAQRGIDDALVGLACAWIKTQAPR